MKTWLKFSLCILISASLFGAGFFTAYKTVKKDKEIVTNEVIKDRFSGLTPAHVTVEGESMNPTLTNGVKYEIYKEVTPQEGDIISFSSPKFFSGGAIKRLIKIREDGAWWVLGDNRGISHDSGDFGWILPSERFNVWVVKVN